MFLAQIRAETAIYYFLVLVVVCVIGWLLWWFVGYLGSKGMPPTMVTVLQVVLVGMGVLILIGLLLSLIGHPLIVFN